MSAIDRWLDQQLQDYQSEKDDMLIKRFTSAWRSEGDQAVLLYEAVQHLAAIRATLERAEITKSKCVGS